MPALRGHHLICLHFFNGEGYTPEFITNLQSMLRSAVLNMIEVVSGTDDICRKCPYKKGPSCRYTDNAEQEIRDMDVAALRLLHLSIGDNTDWEKIRSKIPTIFHKWYHNYCEDCDWKKACEESSFFKENMQREIRG